MKNLKRSPAPFPGSTSTLIDAVMDSYIDWREESAAVEAAYRRWHQAPCGDRGLSFDAYRAALDREESAAAEYQRWIERAEGAQR